MHIDFYARLLTVALFYGFQVFLSIIQLIYGNFLQIGISPLKPLHPSTICVRHLKIAPRGRSVATLATVIGVAIV